MKMLAIGFGNYVSPQHILSVVSPDSAPIKRLISECREKGLLIDASFGRSTKSVIIADNGNIILSALSADTISERIEEIDKGSD